MFCQVINFCTHLRQSGLEHDKHDGRTNEDTKDSDADLVGDVDVADLVGDVVGDGDLVGVVDVDLIGDVDKVEAAVVDVRVPVD